MKKLLCVVIALAALLSGCAADSPAAMTQELEFTKSHVPTGGTSQPGDVQGEDADAAETAALEFDVTPKPTPPPTPTPTPLPTFRVEEIEAESGYVHGGEVNVRSGPGKEFPVLFVLKRNAIVTVTGESGNWFQIEEEGQVCYISKDLSALGPIPTPSPTPVPYKVTKVSSKKAYVNATSVYFREGPHKSYEIIKECERYTGVTITGESGDFYRVKCDGKTGYMAKTYVRIGLNPKNYDGAGKYSGADVLLLAQIAYRESSHNTEGYKAVASVVLNRVRSPRYPNSIERVVFQGNGAQFSPADDANRLRLTKPTQACLDAVRHVINNGTIFPSDVMYFRTASRGTDWGSTRVYYGTYGGNCYFT